MQRLSGTRAMKNARYIQSVAPQIFPAAEPLDGFRSIVPFEVLDRFHRMSDDELQLYPSLIDAANRLRGNNRQRDASKPLTSASLVQSIFGSDPFVGTLHFLKITFKVGATVVALSDTDVTTILQYALLAVPVIAEYAAQYGENHVAVSTNIFELTIDLASPRYNDDMLRDWVRQALFQIYAPNRPDASASMHCIIVLNPDGVVNADSDAGVEGYHNVIGIGSTVRSTLTPYCLVNVHGSALTIRDDAGQYATVLSHEIAEMIVDWPASWPNPEVCDPCASNCLPPIDDFFSVNWLAFFAVTSTGVSRYVGGDPGSAYFDFYIAAIVQPQHVNDCPALNNACNYGPDTRAGISELLFYEQADGYGELYSVDSAAHLYLQTIHRDWRNSWSLLVPGPYKPPGNPLDLLFYDRGAGVGQFYQVGNLGDMNQISTSPGWRTSWSIIIPGKFSDSPYTDLLFYDPSAGVGEFYHTQGGQLGARFASYTDWRTSWSIILPGKFSDSLYTDLLLEVVP